uniref:Uncharacterized protein n=1 Tax=mine drainage metagenome TaxID=410659 RepID=E6QI33_9ZZZZ
MAIKLGAENKRNVIIAGALFCVVAYLAISQLFSSPPRPAAAPQPVTDTATNPAANSAPGTARRATRTTSSSQARKLPPTGLDPTLHLEKLAASESIEYAGYGRNIFSIDSSPVHIEQAAAPARPRANAAAPVYTPPPVPKPPAIDLLYFGYSMTPDGKRRAFFLRGEDIFDAGVGEIVDHRYKIVSVSPTACQITDLSYNNTQILPLSSN